MKHIIKNTLLLCLILISKSIYAQNNVLTLEQAVEMGINNNGNIKVINQEIKKLNVLKKTSFGLDKTKFGVQYGQYNGLNNDLGFSIDQSFKFPTVYRAQKSLNQAYIDAGEQQKLITQNDLIKEIKLNYYQIVYLNQINKLLSYQDSLFERFFKGAQLKFETGESTYLEQITAESKWVEIKAKLNENHSNLIIYKSILQALLFQNQTIDKVDDSKIKKELMLEIDSSALANNPQLVYYKNLIDLKSKEYQLNKSKILPDFSVGYFNLSMVGNYTINNTNVYLDKSYRFQGVQASIAIPIFVRDDLAQSQAKLIDKQIAETNVYNYQVYLKHQFNRVVQDYYKYKSLLDYYENSALITANLMIDNATTSFSNGNISYLEYVQALNMAIEIKTKYLNLINNYNQSIIAIEYLVGEK